MLDRLYDANRFVPQPMSKTLDKVSRRCNAHAFLACQAKVAVEVKVGPLASLQLRLLYLVDPLLIDMRLLYPIRRG